jgi:hypothetical protein
MALVTVLGLSAGLVGCESGTGLDDDDIMPPPPPPAPAQISTHFDDGSLEGWTMRGSGTPLALSADKRVTAPASASVTGIAFNEWWYVGSNQYAGDLGAYYGGSFSYQFQYAGPLVSARRSGPDLVIEASNGRRLTYRYPTLEPVNQWRDYIVFLREGEGWEVDGQRAFESDIRAVLRNVRKVEIRGSRRLAADTGYLDVVLLLPPF